MKLKNVLRSLFFISCISVSAQAQDRKQCLMDNFDYVEFNADSTIRGVYMTKGFKLDGFSIEFDSLGNPKAMGEYEDGIKQGHWEFSDGSSASFLDGELFGASSPGCGSGRNEARLRFRRIYEVFSSPKK